MKEFKPGVETILLMFSNQRASRVFKLPWYEKSRSWVEPILQQARLRGQPAAPLGLRALEHVAKREGVTWSSMLGGAHPPRGAPPPEASCGISERKRGCAME